MRDWKREGGRLSIWNAWCMRERDCKCERRECGSRSGTCEQERLRAWCYRTAELATQQAAARLEGGEWGYVQQLGLAAFICDF
jgi:hypothetical protein